MPAMWLLYVPHVQSVSFLISNTLVMRRNVHLGSSSLLNFHSPPVNSVLLRPLILFSSQFQPISCLTLHNYYLRSSSLRNFHSSPANPVLLRPLILFSSHFQPISCLASSDHYKSKQIRIYIGSVQAVWHVLSRLLTLTPGRLMERVYWARNVSFISISTARDISPSVKELTS